LLRPIVIAVVWIPAGRRTIVGVIVRRVILKVRIVIGIVVGTVGTGITIVVVVRVGVSRIVAGVAVSVSIVRPTKA
jgi:hypothetical protein